MVESGGIGAIARRGGAFLVVGGVAFVVDALTFNLLVFGISSRATVHCSKRHWSRRPSRSPSRRS